ncbi:MAG: tRNA adenosine(34) deaminase TadA [Desulfurivibrio sp.]|nr:tRNA adenosine(34) deaminase TadA [Desulfurivibrio sp.]
MAAVQFDQRYMALALAEAAKAAERGEVPVGALLVAADATVMVADGNRTIEYGDPTAHAEIVVLRRAAVLLDNHRLTDATLYVTLEPCVMCAGAMLQARIARLVYGAADPKAGAVASLYQLAADSRLNHRLEVEAGVLAGECGARLQEFFQARRGRL